MLVATILSARSPTSVLAVVRELNAKGPVTDIMVAITVGGDILVLTLFAICLGITRNACSGLAFDAASFFVDLTMILVSFLMGIVLGGILLICLHFPRMENLILPIGFLTYLICDYILAVSEETTKYALGIDSLLVCISAGFVTTNVATEEMHHKFMKYLKDTAKYVFIPFFTVVGLSINLPVLIASLGFSILACVFRAICMFLGTATGGYYAGLEPKIRYNLWIGLMPQAGVSLGLAGVVAGAFPDSFGSDFQSTIIAIILLNQIIGPLGAKYLIKHMGEDGKGTGEKLELNIIMYDNIDDHDPVSVATQTGEEDALVNMESGTSTEGLYVVKSAMDGSNATVNPLLGMEMDTPDTTTTYKSGGGRYESVPLTHLGHNEDEDTDNPLHH